MKNCLSYRYSNPKSGMNFAVIEVTVGELPSGFLVEFFGPIIHRASSGNPFFKRANNSSKVKPYENQCKEMFLGHFYFIRNVELFKKRCKLFKN